MTSADGSDPGCREEAGNKSLHCGSITYGRLRSLAPRLIFDEKTVLRLTFAVV